MKRRFRLLGSLLLACSMCLSTPAVAFAEEGIAAEAAIDADVQAAEDEEIIPEEEDAAKDITEETEAAESTAISEEEALLDEESSAELLPLMETEEDLEYCPEPLAVEPAEDQNADMEQMYAMPGSCSNEEWEMLRLVNKERLSKGLQPLSTFDDLQASCDIREPEIAQLFSHTRPDGSACYTALTGTAKDYGIAGENIAAGNRAPAATFEQWMNSTGHRENMLRDGFSHMGVGYRHVPTALYRYYWVQMFLGGCTPTDIKVQNTSDSTELTGSYGASIDSMELVLEVTCDHGTSYLPLMKEMCSGYDAEKVGEQQRIKVTYAGVSTYFNLKIPTAVTYRTHVQTHGWLKWTSNGKENGTTGESKRLEAIEIKLEGQPVDGDIEYRTHVQTYGWRGWSKNGAKSGTEGESKRLEAIQIRLTGDMEKKFDIYYRVHSQTFGWLDWAKNGDPAGTEGYAKRLESIQIQLVEKGHNAPGKTDVPFKKPSLQYKTHVQTYGWQNWAKEGDMSGTEGKSKRLEAIQIELLNPEYTGGIKYKTHVQTIGWQEWVENGALSGTEGKSKRLEAIQIELTGDMAEKYDIYYQVHAQTYGWMGWAKNGEKAGTAGYAKRLEGIKIQLVEKGGSAPGKTDNAFIEKEPVK